MKPFGLRWIKASRCGYTFAFAAAINYTMQFQCLQRSPGRKVTEKPLFRKQSGRISNPGHLRDKQRRKRCFYTVEQSRCLTSLLSAFSTSLRRARCRYRHFCSTSLNDEQTRRLNSAFCLIV
jgi:hypothetical protein